MSKISAARANISNNIENRLFIIKKGVFVRFSPSARRAEIFLDIFFFFTQISNEKKTLIGS